MIAMTVAPPDASCAGCMVARGVGAAAVAVESAATACAIGKAS